MSKQRNVKVVWDLLRSMSSEKPHRFGNQIRLSSYFPPYPSDAFSRFCEYSIDRRRAPLSTYLAVTGVCPCRCGHCSYGSRPATQMSLEKLFTIINELKQLGCCTLGLTGGEPMMRTDLEQLVAAAKPELATMVFTTGWGMSQERAYRLAEAGLDTLTVSLESVTPEKHDQVRQKAGSFEKALAAIKAAQQAGLYVAMSSMATREAMNSGEIERVYQFAKELGVGELRINPPIATGAFAGQLEKMLSQEELDAQEDFIASHNQLPDGPAVSSFAHFESFKLFGCGAGFHHLFIDAEGNVCPCDLTPLSFGNLHKNSLVEIWQDMGKHFVGPRHKCIMRNLAQQIPADATLPLPQEQSLCICPKHDYSHGLPRMYDLLDQHYRSEGAKPERQDLAGSKSKS